MKPSLSPSLSPIAAAAAVQKEMDCTFVEDSEFPPLVPPAHKSSTSLDETRRPTPPYPPGLVQDVVGESGRSTPTVPPGLRKPSGVPDLEGLLPTSRPASRAGLKRTTSSQIIPAVPLRPATPATPARAAPARAPTPASVTIPQVVKDEGKDVEVETPTKASKGSFAQTEAQKTIDASVAVQSSKPTETTAQPVTLAAPSKQEEEVEVVTSAESSVPSVQKTQEQDKRPLSFTQPPRESAPRAFQPASKGQATVQTSDAQAVPSTPTKDEPTQTSGTKRMPPGKLDIAAAVAKESSGSSPGASIGSGTPSAVQRSAFQTPSETFKPESPGASLSSPAVKSAPKTIRVVQTPKAETSTASSSSTSREPVPSSAKQPSRQPSLASIQIPGTPSSEQVSMSDYVSVPSTTQSRANSPPPPPESSKVIETANKAKKKSQLKKERQERAKALEEDKQAEEPKKAVSEEPAQEAIVSRKKKAKKEKEPKPKAAKAPVPPPANDSTPTASRAPSPPQKPAEEVQSTVEPVVEEVKAAEPTTPIKAQAVKSPSLPSPHEPSPPPTPTLTAAQLIAELKATAPEIQKCIDSLFRSPASNHYKPSQPMKDLDAHPLRYKRDFKLTKDEVDSLLLNNVPAIRRGGDDGRMWNRSMVTPSGAELRALTEELEQRFIELEKAIRELPEELRFRPTKPQNDVKFPSVDLEGLKRQFEVGRSASVMEQMVQDGSTMKKGAFLVDEASKYINEFVMPPATPPPSVSNGSGRGNVGAGAQGVEREPVVPSPDIAERQLNEARRIVEERDTALKKIIKKNKKILGLG